jgi:tetratricopeptide (TPR) repeat protein
MTPSGSARRALPFVLAALTFASGRSAHAQGAPQAQADALFAEGRDLLERGRYAEACAKLAKSEELAPAVGTLLNLAYCWEQAGKLRSAMDAYAQAEAFAGAAGEAKRASFAKDRYAAVEPRAMKLVVRIAPPEAPGLEIKRNGVVMTKPDFDRPIAVDPEDYVVTAAAPGYMTWKGAIIVKGEGGVVTMIIPPLGELAKPVEVASAPAPTGMGTRRIAALGLGAASALAIGAGIGMAFAAKSRYDDAEPHCAEGTCDETGNAIQRGAVTQGNIATALIALGLLSGGAGVYLWIVGGPGSESSPPPPTAKKGSASVRLEMRPFGAGLGGRF